MSFDIVSYAMGQQAGSGGGSLTDLDSIAFGNDPTLPAEGKTDPANYEAIADAINTAKARGNAVRVVDGPTITENGSHDADPGEAWNSVTVNVPGYTGYETITGTLAAPFGSFSFDEISHAIQHVVAYIGAYPAINYNASAIGAGVGNGAMNRSRTQIFANGAFVASSASSAFMATWDENGLVSAYMEQNGTITDISQYASLITTTIYLPTQGGNT